MGCTQAKSHSIISKKIPVSILKKSGNQKQQQGTLANSEEIEQITKKLYFDDSSVYDLTQNPIRKRRQVTCYCE